MITYKKFTKEDSTKNKPHYQVNFYTENHEYIGEYHISGYYLYDIWIQPEFRGKGLCKTIVNHAVSRKKNLNLDVQPDNPAAIKCYERAGFKFVKEMYYYNPLWNFPEKKKLKILRFKHS